MTCFGGETLEYGEPMINRRAALVAGLAGFAASIAGGQKAWAEPLELEAQEPAVAKPLVSELRIDYEKRLLFCSASLRFSQGVKVAVGRYGPSWKGELYVGRKELWPSWIPTRAMLREFPDLRRYQFGLPGGPGNPLGARALYLYRSGVDTKLRVHGTNDRAALGMAISSGCIRMSNEDIIALFDKVAEGSTVSYL